MLIVFCPISYISFKTHRVYTLDVVVVVVVVVVVNAPAKEKPRNWHIYLI